MTRSVRQCLRATALTLVIAGPARAQGNGNQNGWCTGTNNPHNSGCTVAVPEPASFGLLALGIAAVVGLTLARRRHA